MDERDEDRCRRAAGSGTGEEGSVTRRAARDVGRTRPIALALSLLLIACGVPRTVLTARALVEGPARYDGEAIALVGTVGEIRASRATPGMALRGRHHDRHGRRAAR